MYNFIHYRMEKPMDKEYLYPFNVQFCTMWKQIEHYFTDYPQRKKIAQKMMEYGIQIHDNTFRCGQIELSDSKIARAFQVDRRAVIATRDTIKKEPELLKIFSHLTPTCHLKDVAPHMKWGVIEIIPIDPSMPGILAEVATIIASNNISIRQAIVDDFEFAEEPKVYIITEKQIPGTLLTDIRNAKGVKAVLIY